MIVTDRYHTEGYQMAHDYSKLQNGSDIRGVASGYSPEDTNALTDEAAARLAKGFLYYLRMETGKNASDLKVSIGRDSRLTGEALLDAAAQAMASCGTKVYDAGLASTPAMFMSTVFPEYSCDGAIMITASHMPSDRNGMKFFSADGGLDKGDITDIINFAGADTLLADLNRYNAPAAEIEKIDLMNRYSAHLREIIAGGLESDADAADSGESFADAAGEKSLSGLKIVVDAGNGAGGFYATDVLAPLGADVSASQFLEPDGTFPNHIPNPENEDAMKSICDAVKASGADLGLIFDTDVDRASAVDEHGNEISRNGIVALASVLAAERHPGSTIVTDSVTSRGLNDFLTKDLGLKHLRYRRGYRNVIGKGIELNEAAAKDGSDEDIVCSLAIETSGHAAFSDNYFLDDGAYLAALIVIKTAILKKQGLGISETIKDLKVPAESREFRLPVNSPEFSSIGDDVIEYLKNVVSSGNVKGCDLEEPNYEGVRINFTDPSVKGWLLLRKSLHEPLLPINMESEAPGGCEVMVRALLPLLAGFPEIDTSSLTE
jgi:phosphomannomutase